MSGDPAFDAGNGAPGLFLGLRAADALEDAAEKFMAALNTNHIEEFKDVKMQHVMADLNVMQQQQQQTKTMMNLKRLQMFLDGMSALQTDLGELGFRDVDGAMACIWGPMKFFLKATKANERALDHILEVYQCLGLKIPPLAEYKQLFVQSSDSQMCLVHIYKDVLEFHTIAYKLFSLRSSLWAKLHKATWKDLGKTFDHLTDVLQMHFDFVRDHGAQHRDPQARRIDSDLGGPPITREDPLKRQYHEYLFRYENVWRKFRTAEEARKRKQKDKILRWIAAPNKTEMLHEGFQKTRELCPENGRWLWGNYDPVANWMDEELPQDSAVWVHGRKGMGKTILSSLVVDRLRELAGKGHKVPRGAQVCYFYCQEGDQELDTYLGMLRCLLHQLVLAAVVSNPDDDVDGDGGEAPLPNYNLAILPLCEDKLTNSPGSTLMSAEVAQPLIDAFFENSPRQYVIIDGLDECRANSEVQQAVAFLKKQVSNCDDINQGQLRVLFVSQLTVDVAKVMAKHDFTPRAGEVELNPNDTIEDIRRYIKRKLTPPAGTDDYESGSFNLTDWEKMVIENRISTQSEGLFLYAHLAMEYLLNQDSKGDLLEKVKPGILPAGLSHIYDELLGTLKSKLVKQSPKKWDKARLLLGWLVCAHRPLKWHEIQAILAFDPVAEIVDFDARMIRRNNISNYLGSLVQVLPGNNIRLIHSTAKEHLVQTRHIDAKAVQCDLAILCLRYLSLRCFTAVDELTENQRRDFVVRGYFSFQDYAMSQWFHHIITVMQECHKVFPPPPGGYHDPVADPHSEYRDTARHATDFSAALQKFISVHDTDIKPFPSSEPDPPSTIPVLPREHIDHLDHLPFYHTLLRLWNHIHTHQHSPVEELNRVGLARLDTALKDHRALIESEYRPDTLTINGDSMADYYGSRLYKCGRTRCRFFHHGFEGRKDRDAHQNRHDRPYPCPLETCGFAPVGFSSNKDKERHVRAYHPELSDAPSAFLQMSRRVETAKFQCTICQKSFTRNINLKGHERSHFGERPYACSHCGKAFARLNDCRRHEKIHTRKGA